MEQDKMGRLEVGKSHQGDLVDFALGFCEGMVDSARFALTFNDPRQPEGIRKREVGYNYGLQAVPIILLGAAAVTAITSVYLKYQ